MTREPINETHRIHALHHGLADAALASAERRPTWFAYTPADARAILDDARRRGNSACIAHAGVITYSTYTGLAHDADGVVVEAVAAPAAPPVTPPAPSGRMPRDRAEAIARDVLNILAPTCAQIEIAGSIRRGAETVKDGEIVAIPTPETLRLLDEMTAAGTWTKSLYGDGPRKTHRWGPKYRGIDVDGLRVEIFMTDPESWGYIYWLRTGPGDLNQTFMGSTARTPIRAQDGAIWYAPRWERRADKKGWLANDPVRLALRSEADFFALIGMDFVAPELREMANYSRITVDMQVLARLKMSPVLAADGQVQMGLFGGVQG